MTDLFAALLGDTVAVILSVPPTETVVLVLFNLTPVTATPTTRTEQIPNIKAQ